MDYEEVLMVKTAWYYYLEDMTQQRISELLGISRARVIRLLEKARQTGVIQFKIREGSASRMQIEKQVAEAYDLKDVFVVPTADNGEHTNVAIAKAAAMYISHRLKEDSFINIGYGDTTGHVLKNLAAAAEHTISCVSLTGGVNCYLPDAGANNFNARLYLLPAPLLASSKEMVQAMREEEPVREILAMVGLASFTVVGVGAMDDGATFVKSGLLKQSDFLHLKIQGAVGDVMGHFVNKDGVPVATGIEDRLISTPLSTLHTLENVIGVAAGASKTEAIRAVLKGKYLNVLVTDEDTAIKLI